MQILQLAAEIRIQFRVATYFGENSPLKKNKFISIRYTDI